jgi:hypothetical protein
MATIKKVKAKNLSAGPSKKTPIAPKVDPKGQYTKVQERTLGNMKKGGKIKKAQSGATSPISPSTDSNQAKRTEIYKKNQATLDSARKENVSKILEDISAKKLKTTLTKNSLKKGGKVKKNWIQGAVNPSHKGFCTPMTKKTCTPKRKALAMTFKKMAKARKGK